MGVAILYRDRAQWVAPYQGGMTMDSLYPVFISLPRWALGTTLLLAAATKWLDLPAFQQVVRKLHITPQAWIPLLAAGVASAETAIGLTLLFNWYPKAAASASTGLLVAFTALLVVQLRRGEAEGCGCFGSVRKEKLGLWALIRNALLVGLSLIVCLAPVERWNPLPIPLVLSVVVLATARWLASPKQNPGSDQVAQSLPSAPAITRRDFLRRIGRVGLGLLGVSLLV